MARHNSGLNAELNARMNAPLMGQFSEGSDAVGVTSRDTGGITNGMVTGGRKAKRTLKRRAWMLASAVASLMAGSSAWADNEFTVNSGAWGTASNWSTGTPTASLDATLDTGRAGITTNMSVLLTGVSN